MPPARKKRPQRSVALRAEKNKRQRREGAPEEKRVPIRSCVICRTRLPKHELKRHVCPEPGAMRNTPGMAPLVPDMEQRMPGRGFYVCNDPQCCEKGTRFQGWRRKCKGVPTV